LLEAGKAIDGLEAVGLGELATMMDAFAAGIQKRGGVELGEKTMYDTIRPAADALLEERDNGASFNVAVGSAVAAAEDGMNSTKEKVSQRGRSSRLGDRSAGHMDPGAASMYTFVSTFLRTLEEAT
jgi:dihydroxyacetone kinase-like protein